MNLGEQLVRTILDPFAGDIRPSSRIRGVADVAETFDRSLLAFFGHDLLLSRRQGTVLGSLL